MEGVLTLTAVRWILLMMLQVVNIMFPTPMIAAISTTKTLTHMRCAVRAMVVRWSGNKFVLLVPILSPTVPVKFVPLENSATQTAIVRVLAVDPVNTLSRQVHNLVRPALLVALVITAQQELASPAP